MKKGEDNGSFGDDKMSGPKLMDVQRQQWGMVIDLTTCVGLQRMCCGLPK